ncbi:unnamed protein product [Ascophyllum nodosum]
MEMARRSARNELEMDHGLASELGTKQTTSIYFEDDLESRGGAPAYEDRRAYHSPINYPNKATAEFFGDGNGTSASRHCVRGRVEVSARMMNSRATKDRLTKTEKRYNDNLSERSGVRFNNSCSSAWLPARAQQMLGGGRDTEGPQRAAFRQDKVEDIFSYARHNRIEDLERMLNQGVPVDVRDGHGNTVLIISCQNGHKRALKAALRRGADPNARNERGNTGLHYCHAFGYGKTLGLYLMDKGADPAIRNWGGLLCIEGIGC